MMIREQDVQRPCGEMSTAYLTERKAAMRALWVKTCAGAQGSLRVH